MAQQQPVWAVKQALSLQPARLRKLHYEGRSPSNPPRDEQACRRPVRRTLRFAVRRTPDSFGESDDALLIGLHPCQTGSARLAPLFEATSL
jgi:hypothetical protein